MFQFCLGLARVFYSLRIILQITLMVLLSTHNNKICAFYWSDTIAFRKHSCWQAHSGEKLNKISLNTINKSTYKCFFLALFTTGHGQKSMKRFSIFQVFNEKFSISSEQSKRNCSILCSHSIPTTPATFSPPNSTHHQLGHYRGFFEVQLSGSALPQALLCTTP